MAQWFFEPLLTLRDQLRAAHLQESEEHYLEKLVLIVGNEEHSNAWDNGAVEPDDGMRKGELQALARRCVVFLVLGLLQFRFNFR